jgi:hypothetical protein
MFRSLVPCLALLGLVALPTLARPADEKKPAAPGFVLRVQSLDDLMHNFRYLATLVGREEEAKQFEGMLKARAGGPQGLEGIDAKRPMAIYGIFDKGGLENSSAVALIPIADEKAFLGLVENLGAKAEKGKDGVYTVTHDNLPTPVYFRFAHKHAYATAQNKDALDKDRILLPGAVLPAGEDAVFSATLRIDQIPEQVRDLGISQVEAFLDAAKDQNKDTEGKAEHAAKVENIEMVKKALVTVIKEGRELALRFEVDEKTKELAVELGLGGKEDSVLARYIAQMGKHKSVVAGLIAKDSVMNFVVNLPNEQLAAAVAAAIKGQIKKDIEEEVDKQKKAQKERVFKALEPALKMTDADLAIDFRGPYKDGRYTLVAGLKVADGAVLEKALRNALKDLPDKVRDEIKLDVETAGDVAIHRIAMKERDDEFKKTFGDGPAYFAVRSDAAFLTMGDHALGALKEALKVEPKVGKPVQFELSVRRIAEALGREKPEAPKAAAKAFAKDPDSDKIRFALEAGHELKLRFVLKTPVLTFFHLMEPGTDN